MSHPFYELLDNCPVIAAVKDSEGLKNCLHSDCSIIFILYGDLLTIPDIVNQIKTSRKTAMVHVDLINGLGNREITIDFIKQNTAADGIISTRPLLIKRAAQLGLYTVMRFFVIDSMAFDNIGTQCSGVRPDCIEILPGIMPKVIRRLSAKIKTPIIAGGLINDKEDIVDALKSGAVSVSSTNSKVWSM